MREWHETKDRRKLKADEILSVFSGPPASWNVPAYRVDWAPGGDSSPGALEVRASVLLASGNYQTSSSVDALNRTKSIRYPLDVGGARKELRPRYNRAGALNKVTLGGDTYVEAIAYNAKGQRSLIAYGNGVITRYAYSPKTLRLTRMRTERFTQPTSLAYRPAGTVLQDFAYGCDVGGNVLTIADRTPESGIPSSALGADAIDRLFAYDALYRLRSASGRECDLPPDLPWASGPRCTDLTRTRAYTEQYLYDSVGNIRQLKHLAGGPGFVRDLMLVPDNTTPANNRLKQLSVGTSDYAYAYDDSGNLTEETTSRHFEWDHSNRMRVFRTQTDGAEPSIHAHYLYDSAGQRTMKVVRHSGGAVELTVYVDGVFEHHRRVLGGADRENNSLHVMDDRDRIALVRVGQPFSDDSAPVVTYHLGDHLGSSNVIVGGANERADALVSREEYTPYGETSLGSFARKRYRFTAKERDEESGLNYHGARYYAAWLGRWAGCDPQGILDGLNLYQYVHSNPVVFRDPSGFEGESTGERSFEHTRIDGTSYCNVTPIPDDEIHVHGMRPDRSIATPSKDSIPDQSPTTPPLPEDRLHVGDNLIILGIGGPTLRKTYAAIAASQFSRVPTGIDDAQRMITSRGVERLTTRGVGAGLSIALAAASTADYVRRGQYGRAAVEAAPAIITVVDTVRLFFRDFAKYGSFVGVMGNTQKRASVAAQMLAGENKAAQTSIKETMHFARLGRAMTHLGFYFDLIQLESDSPIPNLEDLSKEWRDSTARDAKVRNVSGIHF